NQAEHRSARDQHERLEEHESRDASPGGSERAAKAQFTVAIKTTSRHQTRDVEAAESEQDHGGQEDRTEQRSFNAAQFARERHHVRVIEWALHAPAAIRPARR